MFHDFVKCCRLGKSPSYQQFRLSPIGANNSLPHAVLQLPYPCIGYHLMCCHLTTVAPALSTCTGSLAFEVQSVSGRERVAPSHQACTFQIVNSSLFVIMACIIVRIMRVSSSAISYPQCGGRYDSHELISCVCDITTCRGFATAVGFDWARPGHAEL